MIIKNTTATTTTNQKLSTPTKNYIKIIDTLRKIRNNLFLDKFYAYRHEIEMSDWNFNVFTRRVLN